MTKMKKSLIAIIEAFDEYPEEVRELIQKVILMEDENIHASQPHVLSKVEKILDNIVDRKDEKNILDKMIESKRK
jgi:hypothetical protein